MLCYSTCFMGSLAALLMTTNNVQAFRSKPMTLKCALKRHITAPIIRFTAFHIIVCALQNSHLIQLIQTH